MRLVLALAIALGAAVPAAAQLGPSKCTALKTKALGAYAAGLATCRSKALAKGTEVDPLCEAKALSKLEKAFEKAENKGDCLEVDDDEFAEREGRKLVTDAATVLEDAAVCCTIAGNQCFWGADATECTFFDGTAGPPGSVCDGTGACIAGPATGADCCANVPIGNGCGIPSTEPGCLAAGGDFVPGGACRPTGKCAIPK
jgi:hypothetical protein